MRKVQFGSLLTGPILSLAVEGERDFSFSSWNNAFLDEFCVWMPLSFCLCAPQGKVKGFDFGELRVCLTFSPPFPWLTCVVAHLVWNASSLSRRFNTECSAIVPAQVPRKTVDVLLYSHFCKIAYQAQQFYGFSVIRKNRDSRHKFLSNVANFTDCAIFVTFDTLKFGRGKPRKFSKRGLDRSQMEQPTEKNKFSYFARSRLRLRKQEIWERDYIIDSLKTNFLTLPDLAFGFVHKRSGNEIIL